MQWTADAPHSGAPSPTTCLWGGKESRRPVHVVDGEVLDHWQWCQEGGTGKAGWRRSFDSRLLQEEAGNVGARIVGTLTRRQPIACSGQRPQGETEPCAEDLSVSSGRCMNDA